MLTKPCGYVKCQNVIASPHAWRVKRQKHCSLRCAAQSRLAAGWAPHRLSFTRESSARGAHLTNERRRKRRITEAVQALEAFITPEFRDALSVMHLARVKALLGRAYLAGQKTGYKRGYADQARQRKAQGRAA